MEEAASGLDCEETNLDKALEKIIEKEKAATDARSLQEDNKKAEKAAAEEHRNPAVERLGETKRRNAEKQDKQAQTAKKGRRSTSEVVQFLKEKSERESVLRVETKGAESKGGYDENASTTTTAGDSAHALFACKRPK